MARPFRTLALGINDAQQNDQTLLQGLTSGINEAITELASPFIDESIFTEALADLTVRGGRTLDGRQLYTDQTSFGDKKAIEFRHLMIALAPSYKQYVRLGQTLTDTPTRTGELLEGKTAGMNDQILGFMGLRPIKVDPLKAMRFKIAEYQRGIREARREFTGGAFGLLRGGPIDEQDIIDRFITSNRARFNVQKEMYKNIAAADILGTSTSSLRKEFKDRQLSDKTFRNLQRGKFDPYFPSEDIIERFREIAKNLGQVNAFTLARPDVRTLQRDFRNLTFPGQFSIGGSVQIPEPLSLLEKMKLIENEMKSIPLDGEFDIQTTDYVPPKIEPAPLPPQPQPVVDLMANTQQKDLNTDLTRTQEALLSPMEKEIVKGKTI